MSKGKRQNKSKHNGKSHYQSLKNDHGKCSYHDQLIGFATTMAAHDSVPRDKLCDAPPSIVSVANDTNVSDADNSVFEDDYNEGMYHGHRGRRYCLSTLRFFGITIILWVSQFLVSNSMKHFGVIDGEVDMRFEFDPSSVAQRVIPQLQENWNKMLNETSNPLGATYYTRQSQRPGYLLAKQGAQANFPVVMLPGFVTSGLEVWQSKECAKRYFRQRIWTGLESARALFTDRNCWREHLALDPYTGMDPEGIRLRAAEGFEAADYFMGKCGNAHLVLGLSSYPRMKLMRIDLLLHTYI
jgi:Lecithin:cholesterol acyltransferase